ncbi:AMP-binding protein [Pseudomaricurvus alkylphenolicus]|uniref:AMP-binding protein n=1 Tax=Pseudomaricurvus alkylphenolicus TaxID=1306991 RepID=UPI001420BCE9|nr:AMP-binding protein [Pseudomaricurvus alkylphenolicus]NIB43380.1 AMP-binding protein [Pseudomaricurvus alkylphenolicus]
MDYIGFHAGLHADRLAVTDLTHGRQLSYKALDRLVAGSVGILLEQGVTEGDRVACLAKNRVEFILLNFACARLGAIFVPLNWRLSPAELKVVIDDCEPSVIYADELAQSLEVEAQDIGSLYNRALSIDPVRPQPKCVDLTSLMLYTSGTTGKPKGVMLSERNLTETGINFSLLGEVDADSHFLCESPMFHIIGMVTSIRPAFLLGAHVSISDRFIPERTFSRLTDPEMRFTHYFCVPQMALALRDADGFDASKLSHMKAIFTGGAPHPEAQIRDWLNDGIAIVDGYGMSEMGTVFGMPIDRNLIDKKAGCVGFGTPRIQARIVDDNNQPVPPGVPGELHLKGDNVTRGYWRREEDYKASFTDDGWFKTGDVLTCDEDGYYAVTDRKKDMFISGGENVYPVEVEAQLVKFPGIVELAVIGVPDDKWGEVGCLFYVPEDDDISLEEVEAYLTSRLAKYKIPKQVRRLASLPRNGVGKLMRHELRKLYSE